jgi:hypothetical protein
MTKRELIEALEQSVLLATDNILCKDFLTDCVYSVTDIMVNEQGMFSILLRIEEFV